jgi:hypothetical protein
VEIGGTVLKPPPKAKPEAKPEAKAEAKKPAKPQYAPIAINAIAGAAFDQVAQRKMA